MNFRKLISTSPPDTVWQIDQRMAVVVHRNRRGEDRCGAAELPPDLFEVGPVGIQAIDREQLGAVLAPLKERAGGGRRAAVVIPTSWVRTFLLEGEDLPRRQSDLDDVVRWRLKKLLPGAPSDIRLVAAMQPPWGDRRQVLCITAPGRAMNDLEGAFEAIGVWPGLILPRLFALSLAPGIGEVARVVVQQEETMLSLLVIFRSGIRLIRTKLLPTAGGALPGVEREMGLGLTYIREQLGITALLDCIISAADAETNAGLTDWLNSQEGVETRGLLSDACSDPALAGLVGSARLAPIAAVLAGGAP
ncbi:MAG: hypothetical protein K8R59_00905 [Thermoanaerobaculales bacterium]|nr:hypothetical protein [Thermoanaerobaculales bacterium]